MSYFLNHVHIQRISTKTHGVQLYSQAKIYCHEVIRICILIRREIWTVCRNSSGGFLILSSSPNRTQGMINPEKMQQHVCSVSPKDTVQRLSAQVFIGVGCIDTLWLACTNILFSEGKQMFSINSAMHADSPGIVNHSHPLTIKC